MFWNQQNQHLLSKHRLITYALSREHIMWTNYPKTKAHFTSSCYHISYWKMIMRKLYLRHDVRWDYHASEGQKQIGWRLKKKTILENIRRGKLTVTLKTTISPPRIWSLLMYNNSISSYMTIHTMFLEYDQSIASKM